MPRSSEKAKVGRLAAHYLADRGADLRTMQDYLGHRDPMHTAHLYPRWVVEVEVARANSIMRAGAIISLVEYLPK